LNDLQGIISGQYQGASDKSARLAMKKIHLMQQGRFYSQSLYGMVLQDRERSLTFALTIIPQGRLVPGNSRIIIGAFPLYNRLQEVDSIVFKGTVKNST